MELFQAIALPLSNVGLMLEMIEFNGIYVRHHGIAYFIILNNDNTYSLEWDTIALKHGGELNRYKKLVASMGIISYYIQKAVFEYNP